MHQADVTIIGAGVIGLAIARALTETGREVVLLEREDQFGQHGSSRNSEVIHAGLYYPDSSLKARWCVEGRNRLYDYCARHGIAHRRCGKLIVAQADDPLDALAALAAQADRNGAGGLEWLSAREIRRLEPDLHGVAALLSPETGIIDSHGFMLSLLGEATAKGAVIAYRTRVTGLALSRAGVTIRINGETEPCLETSLLINCAGVAAPDLARLMEGFPREKLPTGWLARGNYFALSGRSPFRHLIYPLPEPGGLGVHLTLDLAGHARFGPDVEWIDCVDYHVDPARGASFYPKIRRYWPGLPDGSLMPAYAGIRPKLAGPGRPAVDFQVSDAADHGIPAVIHLFGIESPGLTASLAIADYVRRLALDALQ